MRYLLDAQVYMNRYDLHTIEECLDWYWKIRHGFEKERNNEDFKKFSDKEFNHEVHKVCSYLVNVIKGERYRHRAEKINKWMDRDRKTQEHFDNAESPQGIVCEKCRSETKVVSRDLLGLYEEGDRVLFMFECLKCKKRQSIYEDGTIWHYQPPLCPKCKSDLKDDHKRTGNTLTTIYSCPNCPYKRDDVLDFDKSDAESEARKIREKKLFAEFREEFCLDDTNGREYLSQMDGFTNLMKEIKERENKERDPVYQKAKKLKMLRLVQLQELIKEIVEKNGYKDLLFDKPEMDQYVTVSFSVNDAFESRGEYDSTKQLQKLIRSVLEGTNWRLMSEGVHYRLGILTGRLKAYEREEDLMKIVK